MHETALFCVHELTNAHGGLASLWSTGERGMMSFSVGEQDKLCYLGLPALKTIRIFHSLFNSLFTGHMIPPPPPSQFLSFSSSLSFSHPLMRYDISLHLLSFLYTYYFSPLTDEWLLCTFKLACLLLIVASLLSFTYQATRPQALCSSLKFRKQAIYY